jgi:hypothetical protein
MAEPERQFQNCRDVHPAEKFHDLKNLGVYMLSDTSDNAERTAEYFVFTC